MQKFARAVVLAFGLGIVAIALGLFSTHPAGAAGSAPVMVTNTPLPVSLTGTGSISGNVNAAQSGAWNVGINGTPSVNVAGLPAVQFNGTQPVTFSNAEANPIFTRDVDSAAVTGMLDRLLHHGHILKCGPWSCRTKIDLPHQMKMG